MNPSKPAPGITFNTTESMAEWAWRYGEVGVPHHRVNGVSRVRFFIDGSFMDGWSVDSARGIRHVIDRAFEIDEGRSL